MLAVVCRRLSSSVTLPAGGQAGRRALGRSARRQPGAWAVGRLTLHGGPVVLRPVNVNVNFSSIKFHLDTLGMHDGDWLRLLLTGILCSYEVTPVCDPGLNIRPA